MNKLLLAACAALFAAGIAPAFAQSGSAMPTCASGDPVVWENTSSKGHVYHMSGDKYYGNSKHGKYVCESQAKTDGYHPAGGKGGMKSSGAMGASTTPSAAPSPMASGMSMGKHHHRKHGMHGMGSASPAPAMSPSPSAT
jgi:hypothetical protein